jgi:Lon protease-like protein
MNDGTQTDDLMVHGSIAVLPIFPLPETQLFPGSALPLHIFEPRYRQMLADCMRTNRLVGIVMLTGRNDADELPAIHEIGGLGLITDHRALPDGRSAIVLEGRGRVRLRELPFTPPYRTAAAELLRDLDTGVSNEERTSMHTAAASFLQALRKHGGHVSFALPAGMSVAEECDRFAAHLVGDARDRQRVLETLDPRVRVRVVTGHLVAQLAMMAPRGPRSAAN